MDDATAAMLYPRDAWVYDKIQIAEMFGVLWGTEVIPTNGKYCIKPIRNLQGCSIGSKIVEGCEGQPVPDGMAWFEYLEIPHWTADYELVDGWRWEVKNIFVGAQHKEDHTKFVHWIRVEHTSNAIQKLIALVPFPEILLSKLIEAEKVNIEWRANKPIEVHLRHNTDPVDYDIIVPIWDTSTQYYKDTYSKMDGYEYLYDTEDHPGRIGFYVKRFE